MNSSTLSELLCPVSFLTGLAGPAPFSILPGFWDPPLHSLPAISSHLSSQPHKTVWSSERVWLVNTRVLCTGPPDPENVLSPLLNVIKRYFPSMALEHRSYRRPFLIPLRGWLPCTQQHPAHLPSLRVRFCNCSSLLCLTWDHDRQTDRQADRYVYMCI